MALSLEHTLCGRGSTAQAAAAMLWSWSPLRSPSSPPPLPAASTHPRPTPRAPHSLAYPWDARNTYENIHDMVTPVWGPPCGTRIVGSGPAAGEGGGHVHASRLGLGQCSA